MSTACRSAVRELLPWYLNGSLEGREAADVREHLVSCAACARELDDLGEIAELVRLQGTASPAAPDVRAAIPFPARTVPAGRRRRRLALAAGIAAVLAGIVLAALFRSTRPALRDGSGDLAGRSPAEAPVPAPAPPPGTVPAPAVIARLDLGAGPVRGAGETPVLRLAAEAERIEMGFVVPGGGRAVTVRLEDESGRTIAPPIDAGDHDASGRSAAVFPAAPLRRAGAYALVLSQEEPGAGDGGGPARMEYRYPFRSEPADR